MNKDSLKKYSPLGLLALVIVAGLMAVLHHNKNLDGDFEVIGYFSCGTEKSRGPQLVLIADGDTFQVLYYRSSDEEIIARGKPTDLSYFTPQTVSNSKISYYHFKWKEYDQTHSLDRSNGGLVRTVPGVDLSKFSKSKSGRDHTSTLKAIGMDTPTSFGYDCKFGKEGKKLVWKAALEDYEYLKQKF